MRAEARGHRPVYPGCRRPESERRGRFADNGRGVGPAGSTPLREVMKNAWIPRPEGIIFKRRARPSELAAAVVSRC